MLERIGDDILNASKRVLELTSLKTKTVKIAITGLSRSGKSVFITSFIDQLINNKKLFENEKYSKKFSAKLAAPKLSMKRFDYYHFSKQIKKEYEWCDGTDSISLAFLKVKSEGKIPLLFDEEFNIELVDYPGEWLLDLTLLNHTFTSWSAQSIQWLENIDDEMAQKYLQTIKNIDTDSTSQALETSLHVEYTKLIEHLKNAHYSFITPGRFLVPGDMKDDPMLLFAPIYKNSSSLHKIFEKRFKTYVKDVVKGIHLDYFRGFERQIILVDVIEALQNGYACYSDMTKAIESMLGIYSHSKGNIISRLISPSIKKVAFVATKADLVPLTYHSNYLSLLQDLTYKLKEKLESYDVATSAFAVASVKSTQNLINDKNGQKLPSLRGIDQKSGKIVEVYSGVMPVTFSKKEHWDDSLYMYESFLPPKKEYGTDTAFEHINMDKLIWNMIGDML